MIKNSVLIVGLCVILSACGDAIDASWLESKYTDASSKFINLNGQRVHFRDEGAGEVVVLIHGTASSLHTWNDWTGLLKHQFRVIRMDLPGFGLTGPNRNDAYEVSDDVRFLSDFLAALNIDSAHIAGSSLGGRIAWQFALEKPKQVKSLTLMNALGYPQERWPPPIEMAQWPIIDKVMENFSPRFMFRIGLEDVYYEDAMVTETLVDRYYELSRYPGNRAAFPKRVKARLDKDSSYIPEIRVPTLIMWGLEDLYFPAENAYRFHKDIPGSEVLVFPEVGHLPMEEKPIQSAEHFMQFLNGLGSPG